MILIIFFHESNLRHREYTVQYCLIFCISLFTSYFIHVQLYMLKPRDCGDLNDRVIHLN